MLRLGLPSNPRSRSVTGTQRSDYPPRPGSAASEQPRTRTASSPTSPSRSLRAQRSMADLPTTVRRQQAPRAPPMPSRRPNESSKSHPWRQGSSSSIDTSSSNSSSRTAQSSLDYPSSATSLDEYLEDEQYEKSPKKPAPGFGSTLWSRVAAAAGNLSVSVTKAWEVNVNNGESTFGQSTSSRTLGVRISDVMSQLRLQARNRTLFAQ
ncbi:hypothetical protein NM688_g8272 [Phlebia brevispora]|uniref:Uncharacterized protein n=1 Tax=Phlebia brevispora TaxID=194682 RepID=A0ACC1RV38_9APHY|nr:hypothetical protein NM688_g8272 [Phlebia brevispora]